MKYSDLSSQGKKFYKDLKKYVQQKNDNINVRDMVSINMTAYTYDQWLKCVDNINQRGLTYFQANGNGIETEIKNPYILIMKDLQNQLLAQLKEFGLTKKSARYVTTDDQGGDIFTNMLADLDSTEKR